jgi:ABC-type polysaccharide/polyol phosphate transport system ATPase subunit
MSILAVEDLWKKYKIPHQKRDSILDLFAAMAQMAVTNSYEEFWAMKGVSFDLKQGESLGILGANGSGKSTLLKIIAGTVRPTKGSTRVPSHIAKSS